MGCNSVLNLLGCVNIKAMDMGLFKLQVSEESGHVTPQNGCEISYIHFRGTLFTRCETPSNSSYMYMPIPYMIIL